MFDQPKKGEYWIVELRGERKVVRIGNWNRKNQEYTVTGNDSLFHKKVSKEDAYFYSTTPIKLIRKVDLE